ncbi:MAG TPA: long-chain fatty acid--CoA ligase [Rhodopirellula sp.]|nr:long-chain fatty acid--CoA ligase [Rhodopirellula sp.]
MKLISHAESYGDSIAIRQAQTEYTYRQLLHRSAVVASTISGSAEDLQESRVAYLIPGGFDYVTVQWGIWRAGGVAVPLSLSATEPELEYTITDSDTQRVITNTELSTKLAPLCQRLGIPLTVVDEISDGNPKPLPMILPDRRAMILYTSGTTNKPKGVVSTHANVEAQIEALVTAWQWQESDVIPLFLPLHHIHGIINVLSCALWSGATVDTFSHFDADAILDQVAKNRYSVFMAVPTIYVKLIQLLQTIPDQQRQQIVQGFAEMRLMVSGSAALPASVHHEWTNLTGQSLLERYGMTEIGMALSNPYTGERRPGAVGQSLPNVRIQLKSEAGEIIQTQGTAGEIQVQGPCVFLEYWNKPDATADSFDDGWFRTGDIAVIESGYFRIMGRQSVDIIKSGGYKLSALEIESALLDHESIDQCAVVGVADDTWGEAVAVACVLQPDSELDLKELKTWCLACMSTYKIPKQLKIVEQLPRNAMGKIQKPAVTRMFSEE